MARPSHSRSMKIRFNGMSDVAEPQSKRCRPPAGTERHCRAAGMLTSTEGLGSRDSNPNCLIQSQVSYR